MGTTRQIIASELRGLRAKKRLSVYEVAAKTGINKDTIYKYERSEIPPKIDILEQILNVYDYDLFMFFNNEEFKTKK